MLNYCPKCGYKLGENFKFCPNCGNKLTGDFTFCPECGKKIPKVKTRGTPFKTHRFPKPSIHFPKKTAITIIAIVCIVAVGAATSIVLFPFDTSGVESAGRTFIVTIENSFGTDADCYLKVGALKHGATFTVFSGFNKTITVEEDDLMSCLISSDYEITLYATINDIMKEATASMVTESADFLISRSNSGEYQVNCTGYQ